MECPKCGKTLKEGVKFCIYCGAKIAQEAPAPAEQAAPAPAEEPAPAAAAAAPAAPAEEPVKLEQQEGDLSQTNSRRVYWDIQPGQVARVIGSQELAKFKDVRGVVISEGTTAYIRVNGKTIVSISGGVYDFKQAEEKPQEGNRGWNMVRGLFKQKENPKPEEEKALLDSIKQGLAFSIVVLVDKAFPMLVGAKQPTLDDYKTFKPMEIHTAKLNLEVGVNAYFQIADKEKFIAHYLGDKKVLTTAHLVDELSDIVRVRLQGCLENAEWEGNDMPDTLRRALKDQLNENAVEEYFGLSIARIVEISAKSADLERFRNLSREMYLSEQELDYLKRTNDFKNRLAEVQNAQQLHEARTNADLQRQLDEINKDELLRKDELDKFKALLESERRLREARTKEEEDAAMAEIRKTGLMRDIEYKRLEQDAELERRRKEADFEFEQQQREEELKSQRRKEQFEQFMAMEAAANQHEMDMARLNNETEKEWAERLRQQQEKQNDQMMSLLQTMAGARAPQSAPTVPAPAPAPAAPHYQGETKFCSECGAKIPKDSKHCPECGAKLM